MVMRAPVVLICDSISDLLACCPKFRIMLFCTNVIFATYYLLNKISSMQNLNHLAISFDVEICILLCTIIYGVSLAEYLSYSCCYFQVRMPALMLCPTTIPPRVARVASS
ncbi:Os10g0318200 [Oryza sativa Japonica Group]|uniref:Os10g0318200 protein n=1 Tax=Oryza sativa subsp. japonica TaxID=39947 RepID=Q0IYG6_ORYSJ|nr:Os10g0318200 [Oryza sativa Japonica Group]|eukprot:NP_001064335.1 Os10g0318200 [Oryza sativa Japonica Group]